MSYAEVLASDSGRKGGAERSISQLLNLCPEGSRHLSLLVPCPNKEFIVLFGIVRAKEREGKKHSYFGSFGLSPAANIVEIDDLPKLMSQKMILKGRVPRRSVTHSLESLRKVNTVADFIQSAEEGKDEKPLRVSEARKIFPNCLPILPGMLQLLPEVAFKGGRFLASELGVNLAEELRHIEEAFEEEKGKPEGEAEFSPAELEKWSKEWPKQLGQMASYVYLNTKEGIISPVDMSSFKIVDHRSTIAQFLRGGLVAFVEGGKEEYLSQLMKLQDFADICFGPEELSTSEEDASDPEASSDGDEGSRGAEEEEQQDASNAEKSNKKGSGSAPKSKARDIPDHFRQWMKDLGKDLDPNVTFSFLVNQLTEEILSIRERDRKGYSPSNRDITDLHIELGKTDAKEAKTLEELICLDLPAKKKRATGGFCQAPARRPSTEPREDRPGREIPKRSHSSDPEPGKRKSKEPRKQSSSREPTGDGPPKEVGAVSRKRDKTAEEVEPRRHRKSRLSDTEKEDRKERGRSRKESGKGERKRKKREESDSDLSRSGNSSASSISSNSEAEKKPKSKGKQRSPSGGGGYPSDHSSSSSSHSSSSESSPERRRKKRKKKTSKKEARRDESPERAAMRDELTNLQAELREMRQATEGTRRQNVLMDLMGVALTNKNKDDSVTSKMVPEDIDLMKYGCATSFEQAEPDPDGGIEELLEARNITAVVNRVHGWCEDEYWKCTFNQEPLTQIFSRQGIRNSHVSLEPGGLSVFAFRPKTRRRMATSEAERAKDLRQAYGKDGGLTEDEIKRLAKHAYVLPRDLNETMDQISTFCQFGKKLWGKDSIYIQGHLRVRRHMKRNKDSYAERFNDDEHFGIRIGFVLDQAFHGLLKSVRKGLGKKWEKQRRSKRRSEEPKPFDVLPYVKEAYDPERAMDSTIDSLLESIDQNKDSGHRLPSWVPLGKDKKTRGSGGRGGDSDSDDDTQPSPPKKKKKKRTPKETNPQTVHRVNQSHSEDMRLPVGTHFRNWHAKAKEQDINDWPLRPAVDQEGKQKVDSDGNAKSVPICLRYQITGSCTVAACNLAHVEFKDLKKAEQELLIKRFREVKKLL